MQRRALLFPALALAHLGLLMLVLYAPAAPSRPLAPAMAVTAVPDAGVIAQAAPPPETRDIRISVAAPDFAVAPELQQVSLAAAPGAAKAGCELAADVQAALRQSPAVAAAVMHIPVTARSVSNALLLWDGQWAKSAALGGAAALKPIQIVVQASIRAAPAACQRETITGPRLMLASDVGAPAAGGVVLAFGSGNWRWDQLL